MTMFSRSPALVAARSSSLIDPRHPAEYPILLGDAFKDSQKSLSTSISMRFNWKAQKPSSSARIHLRESRSSSGNPYDLTIEDQLHKDKPYRYAGRTIKRPIASGKGEHKGEIADQSLALVWDPAKSAFILEPISASLDFNLISAPDQSQQEIGARKKLPTRDAKDSEVETEAVTNPTEQVSDSDSDADASNPYDFRHFLAEAREKAANEAAGTGSRTPILGSRTPIPGSRTPIPGNRTPLPALSSPAIGAKRATPQFHATSAPSTKKRKTDRPPHPTKPQPPSHKAVTTSSQPTKRSTQPLSSERILDSDSDSDDEAAVVSRTIEPNHRKHLSALNNENSSSPAQPQPSPRLIVSDADAGLEIDLGSPPPPLKAQYTQRKRPQHVDPDAFSHGRNRSRVNTPRAVVVVEEEEDAEEGVEMADDADVEAFELGSPRTESAPRLSRETSGRAQAGRIEKTSNDDVEVEVEGEVEEDDDGLAAELEAALEEEDQEAEERETGGQGLGISVGKEDESEVSEEE